MRMAAGYVLTLLVFFGNIGLPVYSHTCATAGDTFLSVGLHTESCGAHEEAIQLTPPCCHKPKVEKKHACCTETVGRLALSFHFVSAYKLQPIVAQAYEIEPVWAFGEFYLPVQAKSEIPLDRPPPWIAVSHFLSSICTWRI